MKRIPKENNEDSEKFAHKKSLGQNFLTSDIVPKWLCEAADVEKTDTVLEIGPGTGALTAVLLNSGAKIIALEADIRAISILEERFQAAISTKQLTLIHDDARTLDVSSLGLMHLQFKVVANIPYYLSGFLLRNLLETTAQPKTLVFLMQKEVVERIARSKKESLLSLSVKAFGVPKYIKTVTRGHFNPPPKVDSAILQVSGINLDNFTSKTEQDLFFKILHLGFGQKRKQLLSNLTAEYKREELGTLFTALGLTLDVRAETVPLHTWIILTKELVKLTTLSTNLST